ncbi:MAG: 16S rRNA (uracil(1498)-N(3))-methyltransferase [Nitrospiraceae bacterium]|nr:16S rRNA (uracil(1498)-N(3))-methyltransferase [Nitrospiraceae bacterium]
MWHTMNLILLFPGDFTGDGKVLLTGRRAEHILEVHRSKAGDELTVGLAGGNIGRGRILDLAGGSAELAVQLTQAPPEPVSADLILALPRPKVLRRVLQTITTLGVKRIYLINACRVEKSYWSSPFLSEESIREQLIIGLEQARDTMMPEVMLRPLFKPFVEDELPGIISGTTSLVAHPGAALECPRNVSGSITLAIGPEGGFVQYEIDRLRGIGFTPIHMGERILRVEAAVPALLSRIC